MIDDALHEHDHARDVQRVLINLFNVRLPFLVLLFSKQSLFKIYFAANVFTTFCLAIQVL